MKYSLFCMLAIAGMIYGCKKSDGAQPDGGGNGPGGGPGGVNYGTGYLYYDWSTSGVVRADLRTASRATALQYNTNRNGWDISRDGTKLLVSEDARGDYDAEVYTLTNLKDGTMIVQFRKASGYANHTSPKLSPDMTLIGVAPTFDDGIMILDLKGKILFNLVSFQGKKLEGSINWMPDNTILFRSGNGLYRTNTTFTQATLVVQMNFAEWGDVDVSADGRKLAFVGGKHIWMVNIDGSGLTQVTDSDQVEVGPTFSPDGKYLLIGTGYRITGPFGHLWYLAIIPADGKKYDVTDGRTVLPVQPLILDKETRPEPASGNMLWR